MMDRTNKNGFSLIELLVAMAVFAVVMAIAASTFTVIARQSTQQVKMSETQIEDVVGLELLKADIEQAGYGVPLSYPDGGLTGYAEAVTPATAVAYNDTSTTAPRPILSGDNLAAFVINNSDYLVIKSTVAGMNNTSLRWSYIGTTGAAKTWGTDDLSNTDRVVIIRPQASETALKQLVTNGGAFFTQYSTVAAFPIRQDDIIYGVAPTTDLRAPFNRADYYVSNANVPASCAPNTGVLYKATLNHGNGAFTEYPLLDCVADMQIIYRLDMDENGAVGTSSNADGSSVGGTEGATAATVQATFASASLIRRRLKEVRVYILTHEGQSDTAFTYPNATITTTDPDFGTVKIFNLAAIIGGNWQNYRWKVITLVIRPKNLS